MHSYLHRLRHRRRPRDGRAHARRLGTTLAAAVGLTLNVPPAASGFDMGTDALRPAVHALGL